MKGVTSQMKMIEKLEKQINEEYSDAEKYITCALLNVEENKELADMYYWLSQEEVKHAEKLHAMVVDIITAYKKEHGEPPEAMMILYRILHERDIEYATKVKTMIQQYKG